MPFLARKIAEKFLAGPAWSLIPIALPRSDSRLSIFATLEPRSRMQPPWTPVVMRTSKPCSSGLSHRRANPKPASALPVAIASNNWSVDPPKLKNSTSRLCLAKIPRSLATRRRDRAGRVRIPGELELTRRTLQLFAARRGAANKRLAGNIRGRRQRAGGSEDPERRCCPDSAGKGEDRAAGEPASPSFGQTVCRTLTDFARFHGSVSENR